MLQNNNSQNGNVFIIILVAVALFGALMFTFSRSGNQSSGNRTKQNAKIAAQEILNYARLVEGAVDRVRRNNCSENEISFENSVVSSYTNASAPGDNSCHVFEAEGGKANFMIYNPQIHLSSGNPVFFTGGMRVIGVGSNATELTLISPISSETCDQINDSLGNDVTTTQDDFAGSQFTGNFTPSATPDIGNENTSLQGLSSFCMRNLAGVSWFVSVLFAR